MAGPDGSLPPIELIDDAPASSEEAVRPRPANRSRAGALVAAAVLAVAALVAVARSGDPAPPPEAPTARTAPGPTDGDGDAGFTAAAAGYLTGAPRPLLPEPTGASLLVGSAAGWRYVDPSTGWVAEVPALDGIEPGQLVPVVGGVVVADGRSLSVLRFATGRRRTVTAGEPLQVHEAALTPEAAEGLAGLAVVGAPLPTRAVGAGEVATAQADDGSLATMPMPMPMPSGRSSSGSGPGATSTLSVTRPDGRSLRTEIIDARSAPVWLPGGDQLVVLTGLGLVAVTEDAGGLVTTTVPRLAARGTASVLVVPRPAPR